MEYCLAHNVYYLNKYQIDIRCFLCDNNSMRNQNKCPGLETMPDIFSLTFKLCDIHENCDLHMKELSRIERKQMKRYKTTSDCDNNRTKMLIEFITNWIRLWIFLFTILNNEPTSNWCVCVLLYGLFLVFVYRSMDKWNACC